MKQPLARDEEVRNEERAGRLTKRRHLVGITSERRHVRLDLSADTPRLQSALYNAPRRGRTRGILARTHSKIFIASYKP